MLKLAMLVLVVVFVLAAVHPADGERHPPAPNRSGRSVVMAPNGMVAAGHPLAVQVGIDILKKGGNAVDAAIAVNAALGVMEPTGCGIGGDLFAIVWDAKTKKLYGLNASGRSPYKATREFFAKQDLKEIPYLGPLSLSVSGCVDGWEELRKKFGTMSFDKLLEPSIEYAEKGVPVPEVIAEYWAKSEEKLSKYPEAKKTFLPDGRAPKAGEVFKNPRLAATYGEIAKHGRDAFYKGRIAKEMIACVEKHGGILSMKDLEDHTSTWVDPVSANYRGYDIWELPPPGQGIAALQMLNILEGHDLQKLGFDSPDYWHLFVEAKKLAFADRARFYADPEFGKVPVAELISKEYARDRRKLIDPAKAMTEVPHGDPKLSTRETTYLCVVDKDRNCVSLIQSNFAGFGSGLVAGDCGFGLQNRGSLFSLDPKHANTLEPHKRPFHTIIPAMATKDGKPWLVFGFMGGDMQPQGHVQILCNLIDFGMNVQEAAEAPRMEHSGSPSPTGELADKGDKKGGIIKVEAGFDEKLVAELKRRGHEIEPVKRNNGGFQGILIDPKTGILHGGSEPRKDGCAIGY